MPLSNVIHTPTIQLTLALFSGALLYYTIDRLRNQYSLDGYSFHPLSFSNSLDLSSLTSITPPAGLPLASVGISGSIGNTPLIKLPGLSAATGCSIYLKAEALNPGGSPKDRVALSILTDLEATHNLVSGSGDTIYEATVGSTGISLATLCRSRGYGCHIVMPSDQSVEKSDMLRKLGAVVERVEPAPITDQAHFVNVARQRAREHFERGARGKEGGQDSIGKGRGFFADQFETGANWKAHYAGTGPEIWAQMNTGEPGSGDSGIDAFVAGAGTGGTVTGVGLYLKEKVREEQNHNNTKATRKVKVVVADPQGSGLYNKVKHGVMFGQFEREGTRRRDQVDSVIEGIGLTRSTKNFDKGYDEGVFDDAVRVNDQQARNMARWLVEREGVFAGGSTAVNCVAALRTALELGPGHRIVTIWCDSGMRHLSKFWKQIGEIGGEAKVTIEDVLGGRDDF
ncbi:hypothetical protein DV736_g1989, partial [Chaetothyriales sp. CBS 134916]